MNYRRVLVFGAHPDDELSMANAIAKLASEGVEAYVCTPTDGCEGYATPAERDTIVQTRRAEAAAADCVMGTTRRFMLGIPDMGLENCKEHLLRFIEVIREVRPDAIFTHGPDENHRDHIATRDLSLEAAWQAGEPVAARLGEPWVTPYVFYYKSVIRFILPRVIYDTTGFSHIRAEALATQVSQHTLFGTTAEEFLAEARRLQDENAQSSHTFHMPERFVLRGLPDTAG
jgi:LmbE family N-acetylglucosaminyl deacetylase